MLSFLVAKTVSCNLFLNSKCLTSRYRINVQGVSATLGCWFWERAVDSCAMMTRRSVHIRYRGAFRDQNQDVCIYFSETLLCFHTGPEPLCSGDHQDPAPTCWDFRHPILCQTQMPMSPRWALPPHIHSTADILLSSRIRRPRREAALLLLASVVPARVLLKLQEEKPPLETPQAPQFLRRERLNGLTQF